MLKDKLLVLGEVIEKQPKDVYKVRIKESNISMDVEAKLSIKSRLIFLRLLPGDIVTVELSPYDLSKGEIQGLYVKKTN